MDSHLNRFKVYYDSLTEASWFSDLNDAFDIDNNEYNIIERRGKNTSLVERITAYDKPDIILIKDNKPLLVIEITQEVPTGHNVGQRFARLVRSVELGIPTIYYFPFDAKKHGVYSNMCNLNIRLLAAAKRMYQIHRTPLLCVNWPTDQHGEIITDGTENTHIMEILKSYVDSGFDKNCKGFKDHLLYMENEYVRRLSNRPSYGNLPSSIVEYKTKDFIREFGIKNAPNSFVNREKTYVYKMGMTPNNCKRQDPYTGMTFIYDYLVCRNGIHVEDKSNNLVLYFPELSVEIWNENNPNDPATKSCNWYLTANMFVLNNGNILIRG